MAQTAPRRRVPWLILVPVTLLIAAALGWTGFWFVVSRMTADGIDTWIAREASIGRIIACPQRTIGGYPFRIEVRCTGPSAQVRENGVGIRLAAAGLRIVAQIYAPDHVIAELDGPVTVTRDDIPASAMLQFTTARGSFRGTLASPQRVSVVMEKVRYAEIRGGREVEIVTAEGLELHARRQQGQPAGPFELAARLAKAGSPMWPQSARQPADVAFDAVLTGAIDLLPRPMDQRLREWQASGGRLEVSRLRLTQGESLGQAQGHLALNARGRLEGQVRIAVAGLEPLLAGLVGGDVRRSPLGILLAFGERTQIDDRQALGFPLRIDNGTLFFGPIAIGAFEPAFGP